MEAGGTQQKEHTLLRNNIRGSRAETSRRETFANVKTGTGKKGTMNWMRQSWEVMGGLWIHTQTRGKKSQGMGDLRRE